MIVGEILMVTALLFAALIGFGWFLSLYNSLVALKNEIARSWSNIDVLLKQRHDELPKLVSTCEGYMQHERAVFDELSRARAALAGAAGVSQRAEAEGALTRAIGQFFAVAEAYPALKADQSFLKLQQRISEIENAIADRREMYNATVTLFNTRLEQIPDKYVAGWLNCTPAELFKIADSDRRDVEIRFKLAG